MLQKRLKSKQGRIARIFDKEKAPQPVKAAGLGVFDGLVIL